MKKKVERKLIHICFYAIGLALIIFSNIFAYELELFLQLKPDIYKSNSTQVHFIDVGQGDAIAINLSNGETMLVDSGTSEYRKKLSYYLDNVVLKKSKTIDYLVLTHPDIDHSSNMQYLIENYNIKNFIRPAIYEISEDKIPACENVTYRNLLSSLKNREINTYFHGDMEIKNDNLSVNFLSVLDIQEDIESLDTNLFSPVIIINDNGTKLMLTGDINSDIESDMVEKYGEDILDVDILKLAHHGSKYSNSYDYLEITSPEYVVTCVGENSYGHPANDTLDRLLQYDEEYNTSLFDEFRNTLEDGNIIYTLESDIIINEIKNIDNYNFVSYWIYSTIMLIILVYFYLKPYFTVWKKNIRFYIQNKQFEKMKAKEKELEVK